MTLFDRLGGQPALDAAVAEFYRLMQGDAEVSEWFRGIDLERLMAHQRAFLAVGFGGPEHYTGRSMRLAHAGLHITDEGYTRALGHLTAALESLGVSAPLVVEVVRHVERLRAAIVEVH